MTRDQKEMKYTRITAAANCLTTIKTPGEKIHSELTEQDFFPHNLQLSGPSPTSSSSVLGIEEPKPTRQSKPTSSTSGAKKKRIYKSSREANPTAFVAALDLRPKADLVLSSDEFQCLSFLQRVMFIHSAQSWVESISHAAAGAAILYDRLIKLDKQRDPDQPALAIPKSKLLDLSPIKIGSSLLKSSIDGRFVLGFVSSFPSLSLDLILADLSSFRSLSLS
ncbi:hypothetical protein PSHT_16001 [Puccinia striiformis]|uniref:Uncharacterized protein n=1 Tax=Puccinia striiformis TaxID=27350 RepID=A0A2S4UC77_9BASI|nr:hypothetical protein PSHT_16001 [Puccinia striiformis]